MGIRKLSIKQYAHEKDLSINTVRKKLRDKELEYEQEAAQKKVTIIVKTKDK